MTFVTRSVTRFVPVSHLVRNWTSGHPISHSSHRWHFQKFLYSFHLSVVSNWCSCLPIRAVTSMAGHGIANCIRPQRLVCGARRVHTAYSGTPGTAQNSQRTVRLFSLFPYLSTQPNGTYNISVRPPFLGTPVVIPFASVLSLNLH